jgi:hypothetical protein
MAPKHPYLSESEKAVFLDALDHGQNSSQAAKRAKINVKTARGVKKRAENYTYIAEQENRPPPSLHDRTIIAPKTGRRRVLSALNIEQLDNAVGQDKEHRHMVEYEIAQQIEGFPHVSKTTVRNEIHALRYHECAPTKKPALTFIQECERYEIALSRKDWTLEDWKRISFSDEASILVGEHRGHNKLLRKPEEKYDDDCIEVRYKHYSEAMFWGSFSYDTKGPCYVYLRETAAQTERYTAIIDAHNTLQLPQIRTEWRAKEALKALKYTVLHRKPPGKPAIFENFRKNHRLIMHRDTKGGIDYMRYRYEVVEPLIIPYIYERSIQTPHDPDNLDVLGPLFQQDNAPAHINKYTLELLKNEGIQLIEHPGDSPDMNAIEQEWMPLRIAITNVWNRPHTLEWTARAWYAEWEKMPQDTIRGWVKGMIETNQRILDDEGGNHFHS